MTRRTLPQLDGTQMFVTDGGLETELVFHDGLDLPCFAAFPLLDQLEGATRLRRYYDGYLDIAREHAAGFVVETPKWRANPDWAEQLGYSPARLDEVNRAAVALAEEVRASAAGDGVTAVVGGCIGPRGDGYDPAHAMTADEAERRSRTLTRRSASYAPPPRRAFPRRCRSRWRPTAGSRRGSRCMRQSSRWTPKPLAAQPIS
jgi:homocysteine S-methyltransferase